ncbi:DUF3224 domain-containing protein [Microbacterium lushaniae]|nr:DUF3224 domain-containing protein [Microbacterium lushaniae]KAA9156807.1 DUF3224 domain-containing protein [Microbacterium lushaniae]
MPSAESTFQVQDYESVEWSPEITTGLPTGHAHIRKAFTGALSGRAIAQFSYSYDGESNTGTFVALESIEATLDGRQGSFNMVHSSTVQGGAVGPSRSDYLRIVPGSGTGALRGISGGGALWVESDGTHRIRLDYEIPDPPA